MNEQRLQNILSAFSGLTVAVVGDIFLDRLLIADRRLDETSVETGLTAYRITERSCQPGAGGVVAANIISLGAKACYTIGVTGSDGEAVDLHAGLIKIGCDDRFSVAEAGRFTPTYSKLFFRDGDRLTESNRTDLIPCAPIREETEKQIIENLLALEGRTDAIVCLEQLAQGENGVFTPGVLNTLRVIAARGKTRVFADSRYRLDRFRGIIPKCNDNEFLRLNGIAAPFDAPLTEERAALLKAAAERFTAGTDGPAYVSVGSSGMLVFRKGDCSHVPALRVEGPLDICGAGDSALAGIALAVCAGAAYEEAALIGNLVAADIVRQIGTTGTTTRGSILENFKQYQLQRGIQ